MKSKPKKATKKKVSTKRVKLIKKVEAVEAKSYDKVLKNLVKKYGKAQVVFDEGHSSYRRRIIESDGMCKVSYKGNGYSKWSGYGNSCFYEDYTNPYQYSNGYYDANGNWVSPKQNKVKATLNKTIKAMLDHDDDDGITPIEIKYGKRFEKSIMVISRV